MLITQIYLLRHTPVGVTEGICYGGTDVPLASDFPAHFKEVQRKLLQNNPERWQIISSPLRRCARLADFLASSLSPSAEPPFFDDRLAELDFGNWEMRPWSAIPLAEIEAWRENIDTFTPPDGENFSDLKARAVACLREIETRRGSTPMLVITHSGVIRALLADALSLPLPNALRLQIDYGGICRLDKYTNHTVLVYVNR